MVGSDIKCHGKVAAVVSRNAIEIIRDPIIRSSTRGKFSGSFLLYGIKERPGMRRSVYTRGTADYRETGALGTEYANGIINAYIFTRDRQSYVGDCDE